MYETVSPPKTEQEQSDITTKMCSVQGPPPRTPVPQKMAPDQPLPFYLDHNATTPLCDEAWEAMLRSRVAWGNPSSLHPYGLEAKYFLDSARETFRSSLGAATPECVIFTGSGTEANNIALVGGLARAKKNRLDNKIQDSSSVVVLSTAYEHPAVEEVLQMFESEKVATVVRCPIDPRTGLVDVAQFRALVGLHAKELALVTVMHANNELGSVNPIAELVKIVRDAVAEQHSSAPSAAAGICFFHTDAAQSVGKVDVNISRLGVDMLSVCAHKFYGPKGVGALVLREAGPVFTPEPVVRGAKHERGVRPSTENVIMDSAAAAALKSAVDNMEVNAAHARRCRDLLYSELKRRLVVEQGTFEIIENGSVEAALPNTLNIAIYHSPSKLYVSAARMISSLGRKVSMSSGSACHAVEDGKDIPVSTPLQAVGADLPRAIGTLRLTTGKLNRLQDIPRVAQIIAAACKAQMPDL